MTIHAKNSGLAAAFGLLSSVDAVKKCRLGSVAFKDTLHPSSHQERLIRDQDGTVSRA